jgi:tRNA threonylcarbamoyladenosine biosynthesis protein TsaE
MATHISQSPEETELLGERLAQTLRPGAVLGLIGELGAGKTQFVKGIVRGLGIKKRIHSPTFTLVNEYLSEKIRCYHLDLYRLENSQQILSAGLDQYVAMDDAVTIIEWFDRWSADLPQPKTGMIIRIKTCDVAGRELTYEAVGA